MKPLTPIGSPSPLRLLNKGPDYLRRQMDSGTRGGHSVSAVERLEADKAKYVKSQQVINTKQEPALVPCATPPPQPRRNFTVPLTLTPVLPRRTQPGTTQGPPRVPVSLSHDDNEDSRKENLQDPKVQNQNNSTFLLPPTPRSPIRTPIRTQLVAPHSAPVLRRSTGKRMLRPDSLLIYRQKKECKSPSSGEPGENVSSEVKGYSFVRRFFHGSMRDKSSKMTISEEKGSSRDGDSRMSWSNDTNGTETRRSSRTAESINGNTAFLEPPKPTITNLCEFQDDGNGNNVDPWLRASLRRSESDLHLRLSIALSEHERFFDFCGLDRDMVDHLGPENFLSGGSSVDTLSLAFRSVGGGSEPSEFSLHSRDGLVQEEVAEQTPTGVSIIERNARVIKWLYSCKNAAREAPKGPKESTV